MAYAKVEAIAERLTRDLSADEEAVAKALLDDAAVIIDSANPNAPADAKRVVSLRMVMRALGDGGQSGVPMGASQGSMSGLGYSQSWTIGSGGSTGEIYLSKLDKQILGMGNKVGSYSPVQQLTGVVS